jgi:hypothetical protein
LIGRVSNNCNILFLKNQPNPSPGVAAILREDCSHVTIDDEAVASEIAATARSLKTNLILSLVVVFIVLLMAKSSDTIIVLAVSTLKGLVPILTTITNFGKIQNVLALYWQNLVSHLRQCFKYSRSSNVID